MSELVLRAEVCAGPSPLREARGGPQRACATGESDAPGKQASVHARREAAAGGSTQGAGWCARSPWRHVAKSRTGASAGDAQEVPGMRGQDLQPAYARGALLQHLKGPYSVECAAKLALAVIVRDKVIVGARGFRGAANDGHSLQVHIEQAS